MSEINSKELSWVNFFLKNPELQEYRKDIQKFIKEYKGSRMVPLKESVFRPFQQTNFDEVKVVVLGKYPYDDIHKGLCQANGLAYATDRNEIPEVLRKIVMAIDHDLYPGAFNDYIVNTHISKRWGAKQANQGVFMWNIAQTCEVGNIFVHQNLWHEFSTTLIKKLSEEKNLVWVFFGQHIQPYKQYVVRQDSQRFVERNYPISEDFVNSRPFSEINNFLIELGHSTIEW